MKSTSSINSPILMGAAKSSIYQGDSQTSLSDLEDGAVCNPILAPDLDGNEADDPVVICGFSLKFPQDATSSEGLWKMMMERRCAMTEFPPERVNGEGFYNSEKRPNTMPLRGGHFIKEDLALFDADFFGISATEASAMDPMQRWLLETSYGALENAGIPMETLSGSSTGVYTGSFGLDYMLQLTRDPECMPKYAAVGFGLSMLANRLSWFYNLHGPSVGLDSACSSSAMAVDIACQAIRSGSCETALVAGANLINAPEPYMWMSNLSFLSSDSKCYSFDHRANGYARGEGMAVVVLKKLSAAIRDGNTIRAVIRATGSNEDGKTPGIMQPNQIAQERLIQETYTKAGLSMAHTRFFEAHGTGTPTGDPKEARAIGKVFQKYRSACEPLLVGSVKSNIGHLEGASGLAGLIKVVLALERGTIPPNANFEKVNPEIDAENLRIKFPQQAEPWPTSGLRRASVNSFGYGGSNCHIVLDDAFNYLHQRSLLHGKHCTVSIPPEPTLFDDLPMREPFFSKFFNHRVDTLPKLLVWSSTDREGIARTLESYHQWVQTEEALQTTSDYRFLDNLAYTLDSHRSSLAWRSFGIAKVWDSEEIKSSISDPVRVSTAAPRLAFIFNGQGAQWFAMGRELLCYASFEDEILQASKYLRQLGSCWYALDELLRSEEESKINDPELSQSLCTILQVALVNLLRRFDVKPSAVVGHSSGEIAAAYAAGYISLQSAWKIAYYRGVCSAHLVKKSLAESKIKGSMLAVGLSDEKVQPFIDSVIQTETEAEIGMSVACINGPTSVTISGEEPLIDRLKLRLDNDEIFNRKLRVPLAYHSRQMNAVSAKYISLMGELTAPDTIDCPPMISSVTGERAGPDCFLDPSYWALNMTSPVKFLQAISVICERSSSVDIAKRTDRNDDDRAEIDIILEIGPHATLQGPVEDYLRQASQSSVISYHSILRRGQAASKTMLPVLGEIHCLGVKLNLRNINEPEEENPYRSLLVDLPTYAFDRSQSFWHESRLSRNYRLREHPPNELLGTQAMDWNDTDARWRHFLRLTDLPWAEQHVVNGTTLYPGAGMLVMAIEAAKQLTSKLGIIDGYSLRHVVIENAMDLTSCKGILETQTSLRELQSSPNSKTPIFEFIIRSIHDNNRWRVNCRGMISVEVSSLMSAWEESTTKNTRTAMAQDLRCLMDGCTKQLDSQQMYSFLMRSGYNYGPAFQAAQQWHHETAKHAVSEVSLFDSTLESHVVHPSSLDVMLHVFLIALSSGGTQPIATCIPTRIGSLWVSNKGLNIDEADRVYSYAKINHKTGRGVNFSGGALDSDTKQSLRLWFDDIDVTNVTSLPRVSSELSSLPNPRQFYMEIESKPSLNMLSNDETMTLLNTMHHHPSTREASSFDTDLTRLVFLCLEQLIEEMDSSHLSDDAPWRHNYLSWAKHHVSAQRAMQRGDNSSDDVVNPTNQTISELREKLSGANQVGRVYAEVAGNILALIRGEVTPLSLLMHSGLLKDFYEEIGTYSHLKQLASYVDLLAHQNPGMKILEVGGGTGSATRNVIRALASGSSNTSTSLRCSRYDFTDVSPAFLSSAESEFSRFAVQMTFSVLDVEKDFDHQGFEAGSYDIVLADNVLHVSSDLSGTLANIRKVLKPGGKLIMHELLETDGWTAGFIFGLFPGWWSGAKDSNRELSPTLGLEAWDSTLRRAEFSGTDLVFQDPDDTIAHRSGCLVSNVPLDGYTTINPVSPPCQNVTIIVDPASRAQADLASAMVASNKAFGKQSRIRDLSSVASDLKDFGPDDLIILLLDYNSLFLTSLSEETWKLMQAMISESLRLLWVTSADDDLSMSPDHGLLDGLARTLRFEFYDLQLVTVALEFSLQVEAKVSQLAKVVEEMMLRVHHTPYEQDYIELDGRLHIRRLIEANHLKLDMESKLTPFEISDMPLSETRFSMVDHGIGTDDALSYVWILEDEPPNLSPESIDIKIEAVALGDLDRACARLRDERQNVGEVCSGVVVRSGSEATVIGLGTRVVTASRGCLGSHLQIESQHAVEIPEYVSSADACKAISLFADVYHSLLEVARVHETDSVLIHDAANPLGLAALQLLKHERVADVWATASTQDECQEILGVSGIPQERIFPKSWFDTISSMESHRLPQFDIILSFATDSSTTSRVSMKSVRSGGRYIMIRSGPPSVPMTQTLQDISPSVSWTLIQSGAKLPSISCLTYALVLASKPSFGQLSSKTIQTAASDLTTTFAQLRDVSLRNPIIAVFNKDDTIKVRIKSKERSILDSKASYVVAGGLGGLGRSITRWLAQRGARHIILLSRSGPREIEAQELILDLEKQGVQVETPICDITDRQRLKAVLGECFLSMPPVKGCIQASMVMTERIFQKMSFDEWEATIKPKVDGSWNLHSELPAGMDFFIFTSSMMGILGSGSLAAYNAANTYQDALARYRVSIGERATALNLGPVADAGYLVEARQSKHHIENMMSAEKFAVASMADVCALFDSVCDSQGLFYSPNKIIDHAIMGIRPISHWKHLEEVHLTMQQPFWGHLHHFPTTEAVELRSDGDDGDDDEKDSTGCKRSTDIITQLDMVESLAEGSQIVATALSQRVSIILGTKEDCLDFETPMHSYGLDSLSAIDLRNWIGKLFDIDVPVFEILGGATCASMGVSIAQQVFERQNTETIMN